MHRQQKADSLDITPDGTQAIRRAAAILRFIASAADKGTTLREVSEATQLSRSTTHRILKCLVQENLASQSDDAKSYMIGALTSELGLARKSWSELILKWRPAIDRISNESGATAYLMGRSGVESVCLAKAEGSSVIRVLPVEVGQRRPLGVGAGAAAILAALPDEECDSVMATIEPFLHRYASTTVGEMRALVQQTRETGFAESWGHVVVGVYGLGLAVPPIEGPAVLALSLAVHQSMVTDARRADWKHLMKQAVDESLV